MLNLVGLGGGGSGGGKFKVAKWAVSHYTEGAQRFFIQEPQQCKILGGVSRMVGKFFTQHVRWLILGCPKVPFWPPFCSNIAPTVIGVKSDTSLYVVFSMLQVCIACCVFRDIACCVLHVVCSMVYCIVCHSQATFRHLLAHALWARNRQKRQFEISTPKLHGTASCRHAEKGVARARSVYQCLQKGGKGGSHVI